MDKYISLGKQEGEVELTDEDGMSIRLACH